jgi:hypothetical protein
VTDVQQILAILNTFYFPNLLGAFSDSVTLLAIHAMELACFIYFFFAVQGFELGATSL